MSYRLIAEIGVFLGVVVAYELYVIVGKLDEILQRMEKDEEPR